MRLIATNIQRLPAAVELGSAPLASQNKAIESRESESLSLSSPVPRAASHVTAKERIFSWYSRVFGDLVACTRTASALKSPEAQESREGVIVQENPSWINPSFVRYAFEVRFLDSYWRVPTALRVYAVSDWWAPVFEMCKRGDWEGLQVMFSSESVSLFVIDEDRMTLLHVSTFCMYLDVAKCDQYAAHSLQADIFHFLLRLGLDTSLTTFHGAYDCVL